MERDIKKPAGSQLEEALAFVRQQQDRLAFLCEDEPFGDQYTRWDNVTNSGLAEFFGRDSDEYRWVYPAEAEAAGVFFVNAYESAAQRNAREQRERVERYHSRLADLNTGLQSILDRYQALPRPGPTPTDRSQETARAFISHGGSKASLQMIEEFLRALGVEPVVVEKRASEGRELHENVDVHRRQCDFGIVLWTKDVQDSEGSWLPSGSVAVEMGELRSQFPRRVIYLKENGVTLPAMASTPQYQPFTDGNMGPAYLKIVMELQEWGFLRVAVPEDESAV
jgi:predicted nucleotide-binding protein